MGSILFWGALLLLFTVGRPLLSRLFVTFASKETLERIGREALARQPQRITLQALAGPSWKNPQAMDALCQPLLARGFVDAGGYSVHQMPGVLVRFLLGPDRSVACAYEHPKARGWVDIVCKYEDGSSLTVTSGQSPSLGEERPGVIKVRLPGATADALWARAQQERGAGALKQFHPGELPAWFEQAFADDLAWRLQKGVTAQAVKQIGVKPIRK